MRLLIVADDRRSRQNLSHLAAELGHTIATTSAREGAARFEREPFDLLMVELRAPQADRMKLIQSVRRRHPAARVVVLTASPKVQEAITALDAGPVHYVRSPVDAGRVHSVLQQVERELPPPDSVLESERVLNEPLTVRSRPVAAHELGEGRLELGVHDSRVQKVLRIDATGAPPNLLARLLVGSYITGQDQVLITARHGVTPEQRSEIHRLVDRTLGMSVVGDSPELVEVQNFVDPGKHELPRLLHRVAQMLRAELEICRTALSGDIAPQLDLVDTIEEEVDRFYLLMVRQLLLSSDNPRVARNIDVESHHFQIGYRLVAKVLEVTGDLIQGVAAELQQSLTGLRRLPRSLVHELSSRIERLDHLLTRTMDAFDRLSVVDANATLNVIGEVLPKDASFGQTICRRIPNRRVAVSAQRIAYNLDMALEMLIVINEVTINRSVEPEMVARTGTRVPIASSRHPRTAKSRGGPAPSSPG